MVTFNQEKLASLIGQYKNNFGKTIHFEKFKWQILKCFHDNWDIEAEDFGKMFDKATSLTGPLLASMNKYPRKMIIHFIEKDAEGARNMFRVLYDNNKSLKERILEFKKMSADFIEKYFKGASDYQDLNTITTYLWMRYPDKYYIYKYSITKRVIPLIDASIQIKKGATTDNVEAIFKLYDEIKGIMKKDDELKSLINSAMDDSCFTDDDMNTTVIDFFYNTWPPQPKQPEEPKEGKHIWLYQPGEQGSQWDACKNGNFMSIGWDELGDLTEYESRDEISAAIVDCYKKSTRPINDSLALWNFANEVNVGDIIYAKKGIGKILGRGIVTGEYYYVTELDSYKHIRNVRWEKVGEWDIKNFAVAPQKTLTDITNYTDFLKRLDALIEQNKILEENVNYWWLNANPKMWVLSDWAIGQEQNYTLYNENGHKRRIFQNFVNAKVGDKVICYEATPTKQISAFAVVSRASDGESIFFEKTDAIANPISYDVFKNAPELQNAEFMVNPNGSFFKLTKDEYDYLKDIVAENNEPVTNGAELTEYTKKDFLKEVFMDESRYDLLKNLIQTKCNVILQGAPGVGKTFCAERMAYSMMGVKDESRIQFVQFHQNYCYEDFIMGYKPSDNSFEVKEGVFYWFCNKAKSDPDNSYFFIIDEINRGNLSKIFGELLMSIEKDYRNKSIKLPFEGRTISVPDNLYIIGMMNTADRSLALLDYALRRRFSFFEMKPEFDSDGFKKKFEKCGCKEFNKLIDVIKDLNREIANDDTLGSGFEIGHSYFCSMSNVNVQALNSIVKFDLIPMLKEYWFDNKEKVEEWSKKLEDALK